MHGVRAVLPVFLSILFIAQAILPVGGGIQSVASTSDTSARDSAAAAAPRAGTGITISDTVIRKNVTRLGINLWGASQWDDSLTALKNLVPDPGFEPADFRSNILLRADGSNSTAMMQDLWQLSWNNDSSGIGQPAGFWDGAQYEFVYGAAKGINGTITRFYYAPDGQGVSRPVFALDRSVPLPSNSDVMTVRKKFDSNYLRSINATSCQWDIQGDKDIFFDMMKNRPGTAGEQSLRMGNDTRIVLSMDTFYRDGDVSCGKSIIVKGDWNISFWAKGETGSEKVRVQFFREFLTPLFCQTTVTLSPGWFQYNLDFSVPYGLDEDRDYNGTEPRGILNFNFDTTGQGNTGRIWLDDIHLGKRGQANPTVLSDNAMRLLRELNPGILRGWYGQLGISLEEFTDPAEGRCIAGFRIGSRNPGPISYSAYEFLEIAQELIASAWLVIPPTFSAQEYRDLIDFISGPTSTPYGAKRAALGRTAPWTEAFDTIFLEWGNELWGNGTDKEFFGGASVDGGVRLGSIANRSFAAMRSNPSFDSSKLSLVIGGHKENTTVQSEIGKNSDQHDMTGLAPYFYGALSDFGSDEDIYGPLYALPSEEAVGSLRQSVNIINSTGSGAVPAIYEVNFHTTWPPGAPKEVRNMVVTGIGGGIALSHSMLIYLKELGIQSQCAFCSWLYSYEYSTAPSQYVRLFGLLRDLDRTGHKRPTWLGMEIVNKAMVGDLVTTEQFGENPSWLQQPLNGLPLAIVVPYIQSFAFRDGKDRSLVVYNLHRTDALNVSIHLPAIPEKDAVKYVLGAPNLSDGNEKDELVKITSVNLTDFGNMQYFMALPPHSITVLKWRGNLPPVANFTFSPAGPLALEPVVFSDTSTDPDGSIVNWSWSFSDGSPMETTRNVTHSFPDDGDFSVRLSVTDDERVTRSCYQTISVGNIPPICHAAADLSADEDAEVSLGCTGDDTPRDRATLKYRWDFGDNTSSNWSASPFSNHSYRQKGNYTATVTVRDEGGLTASDTLNISIKNIPPDVFITSPRETDFIEDQLIDFTGAGNDTPSDVPYLRFMWDLGDGNITQWSPSVTVSHAYPQTGLYTAVLTAKDDDDSSTSSSISIRVRNIAPSGTFDMSTETINEDETVRLTAVNISDTPSDMPSLNLSWYAGIELLGHGNQLNFTPFRLGSVNIRLVITDDDGANSTSFKYLTVIDPAPRAAFRASAYVIDVNGTVEFDAQNTSDNPSDIGSLSFSWDFGDGDGGMGKTTSHKYISAGNFNVKLTVQDDEGAWNTSEAVISVNIPSIPQPHGPNRPPADKGASSWYPFIIGILAFFIALISIAMMRRKGPVRRA